MFGHIGYAISNAARSIFLALTHARFSSSPTYGPTSRYYQHINRYSAAFALAADISMLTLGGELKRKELLSARLGDVFSSIYLASMVLKHFENQGSPAADLPLVEWSCRTLLYQAQEQLHSFIRNFPNRFVKGFLRILIFPRGRTYFSPSDELGQQIVDLITHPTETRDRLCAGIYKEKQPDNPLGLLQAALEAAEVVKPLEEKLADARRAGIITSGDPLGMIDEAEQADVLTSDEAGQLREFDAQVMQLINVDDFDSSELAQQSVAVNPPKKRAAGGRR